MNRRSTNVSVIITLLFAMTTPAISGEVRWLTGSAEMARLDSAQVTRTISELADRSDARHIVVQFDQPVTQAQRRKLESGGLTLLNYLGDNAFFAALASDKLDTAALANVRSLSNLSAIEQAWKLHPFLNDGNLPAWAIVPPTGDKEQSKDKMFIGTYVLFHRDVVLDPNAMNVCLAHGARIRSVLHSINGLVIELPFDNIRDLADEDAVQWIEPALPKFTELNDDSRVRTGANIVQAAPYGLDGSGVTVLVYDGGSASDSHLDFGGRLTVRDSSEGSGHATHVAGTIGGDGTASGGTYKGMAPAVILESYGFQQPGGTHEGFLYSDPGDIEADYDEAINVYGADISNNSIGTNTATNGFPCEWEGNYGVTANLIDAIVRGSLGTPFRIVWANGNERSTGICGSTYQTTAPPACAKNHIAVGALHSNDDSMTWFSSWGPCDDDRMRPDISAPGCQSDGDMGITSCSGTDGYTKKCGTSMASPAVCGLSALLLQDYRAHYPSEPDFRNSTLKILLAHTAVDIEEPGPDYKTGYGSVRVQPAIDLLRSSNFLEAEVSHGGTATLLVVVNPGDPELKVMLAWDDFPGTPNVNPALVNDLDLRVFSPLGVQAYPWTLGGLADPSAPAVQTRANHVDNIEQVLVESPEEGIWVIEVRGFNVPEGPQPFSLCATPSLFTCLSQGVISLDSNSYACESTATIQIVDCDLNADDETAENVTITISSDSEPGGETVLLTETGPATAAFIGSISLSETDGAGVLLVAAGDTATATYIDADDGQGGVNVVVTNTAVVDCASPLISNVQSQVPEPRCATITFDTTELTRGTVRYGLSCGSLTETATENDFHTIHTINLTGLYDDVSYFFLVEAEDEAGNPASDDNGGACYTFTTPEVPKYFAEQFGCDNDLDYTTLVFTPNASQDYYTGCAQPITSLPTNPSGGTVLNLPDDDYEAVTLSGGKEISLYGTRVDTFYVSSNGYITFPIGDWNYHEYLARHFDRHRISALYDDLNPDEGGTVSWKQLADRAVVTYQDVPEDGVPEVNTFQIEMYFDGRIALSYLDIAVIDGVAGLSEGAGLPEDFYETDLSAMGVCSPRPPIAPGVQANTIVSIPVTITLTAFDDGLPSPPAMLTYIITELPEHGDLTDPGNGAIASVPYELVANGDQVVYQPDAGYGPIDGFEYKANDGGSPPGGGDSNTAPVEIIIGGPGWDPVAYDMELAASAYEPTDIVLDASDPNGDPLTYIVESLPPAGEGKLVDLGADQIDTVPYTLVDGGNAVRYLPVFGQTLETSFLFSVRDATAGSNVATVTLTVEGDAQFLVRHDFPMDSDPGWSTEGEWEFGVPAGGGSHDLDPTSGHTGTNVFGYDIDLVDGDYGNDMSATYLTTTALDCSEMTAVELRFWKWLGVEHSACDNANIEVSNNGTDWNIVWEHSSNGVSDTSWSQMAFDISETADEEATVYIRWGMGPTDSSVTYPGWNIDDVEIWAVANPSCDGALLGDVNLDTAANGLDIQPFIKVVLDPYSPSLTFDEFCASDADGDGFVTFEDIDDFVNLLLGP